MGWGKQHGPKLYDSTWPFRIYRNSSYIELKFPLGIEMKELGARSSVWGGLLHEHLWPFHKMPMLP